MERGYWVPITAAAVVGTVALGLSLYEWLDSRTRPSSDTR